MQQLANNCEFPKKDEHIRDQLIVGMNNEVFDRVLSLPRGIAVNEALVACRTQEFIMNNRTTKRSEMVNSIQKKSVFDRLGKKRNGENSKNLKEEKPSTSKKFARICFRCGADHNPKKCPYHEAECYTCHKRGHISTMCNQKRKKVSVKQLYEGENKLVGDSFEFY